MRLEPDQIVDRYRVEAPIGDGGFSTVYRIRHVTLGTVHALKVLKINHPELQDRLIREGRLQASLKHPNIVAVSDVIEVGGAPALVLDFVAGGSLDQRLAAGPLGFGDAEALALDLIEAVAAAHAAGVIHRDLKPGNVLLTREGGRLVAKITDFGIARVLFQEVGRHGTRTHVMMGTPEYMSPEQIENARDADERSDLFSLGAVLYELVSGRQAFAGPGVADVLYAITHGLRVPLAELQPALPARVVQAVEAALRVDRSTRVESAEQLRRLWLGEDTPPRGVLAFSVPRLQTWPATLPAPASPTLVPPSTRVPRVRSAWLGRLSATAALTAAVLCTGCVGWWWSADPVSVSAAASPPVAGPSLAVAGPPLAIADPIGPPAREDPLPVLTDEVGPAPPALRGGSRRPEPTQRAAAEVPPHGSGLFEAVGGAERVVLIRRSDGARLTPGRGVLPGVYDLEAWFADEPALAVELGVRIAAGAHVVVSCDADFYTCTARATR